MSAQRRSDSTPKTQREYVVYDPQLALPSDTGRMLRGHRQFDQYTRPSQCYTAVLQMTGILWRTFLIDTMEYSAMIALSFPQQSIDAGRSCLASLGNMHSLTDPLELEFLQRLALLVSDDTLANNIIAYRMGFARSNEDSAKVLWDSFDKYLDNRPRRFEAATQTLALLDRLSPNTYQARLSAHWRLLEIYSTSFDLDKVKQEGTRMLAICAEMETKGIVLQHNACGNNGVTWWEIDLAVYNDPSRVPQLASAALDMNEAQLRAIPPGNPASDFIARVDMIGQPAPPLQLSPSFWFRSDGTKQWPVPGKASYILYTEQNFGAMNYRNVVQIRRALDKYGSSGLDVTIIVPTAGYTRWSDSPPQTPEEEAESVRQYYQDILKVPVSVVVEELPFTRKPDGRRVNERSKFLTMYHESISILTDRAGRVVGMNFVSEGELNAYIRRALRR